MDIKDRKGYLTMFFQLLQHLPIRYAAFVYRRSELAGDDAFVSRMRRDIVDFVFDNLEYFGSVGVLRQRGDARPGCVQEPLRRDRGQPLERRPVRRGGQGLREGSVQARLGRRERPAHELGARHAGGPRAFGRMIRGTLLPTGSA